jgi:hypothetical protein
MDPDYFDALYTSDADPWRFASSEYESAKYQATLHALPKARYDCALEVGCSIERRGKGRRPRSRRGAGA